MVNIIKEEDNKSHRSPTTLSTLINKWIKFKNIKYITNRTIGHKNSRWHHILRTQTNMHMISRNIRRTTVQNVIRQIMIMHTIKINLIFLCILTNKSLTKFNNGKMRELCHTINWAISEVYKRILWLWILISSSQVYRVCNWFHLTQKRSKLVQVKWCSLIQIQAATFSI